MVVWTDHKNLAYLQTAKRLNGLQARWALFFTRFNLTITYRPGSKNTNQLSCQFAPVLESKEKEKTILPASCIVGSLTWEVERMIWEAQQQEPDPGSGPASLLFVPSAVCGKVLHWAHTARFACHPDKNRTIQFLQQLFWWPSLIKDTPEYVAACPVCAQNKMQTAKWPWSHIALDFVTGLPPSAGNTAILTIVDWFSKTAHFVALPKSPTALETAKLLTQHVFCLHGIPQDIISEGGPQFTSQVWREFCSELRGQLSLSSGFHSQTTGQVESTNQELEAVDSSKQNMWSDQLAWVEYAHNTSTSTATGVSPFEASWATNPHFSLLRKVTWWCRPSSIT